MKFTLSTDTCCDNYKSYFKTNKVSYFGMKYNYDEKEYIDHFQSEKDYNEFYAIQNSGKVIKTSGVNIEEMKDYFTHLLKKEKTDIVHLALSSGLSCTFQNAKLAADEVNETSENKIYVIDSLSATIGMSMFLDRLIEYRNQEKTAEEAVQAIEQQITDIGIYFFVNDLDTLKRGGRISAVAATVGKALQLKPVLSFNEEGRLEVLSKVIGEKKAVITLLDKLTKSYNGKSPIYVVYGENKTLADSFVEMIKAKLGEVEIKLYNIGPMICAHTGPSILGLCYFIN